jgi:hypothetical protein
MKKMIPLTKFIHLPNTAHILYIFENKDCYIRNLLAYIKAGVERGHHLLIIESKETIDTVKQKISMTQKKINQDHIHFEDNNTYYQSNKDFHSHHIIDSFKTLMKPYLDQNIDIRTWANVQWMDQDNITSKLEDFEKLADCTVNDMGVISVCTYAASDVSASLQTALMRSHEFFMTDEEIARSTFYQEIPK